MSKVELQILILYCTVHIHVHHHPNSISGTHNHTNRQPFNNSWKLNLPTNIQTPSSLYSTVSTLSLPQSNIQQLFLLSQRSTTSRSRHSHQYTRSLSQKIKIKIKETSPFIHSLTYILTMIKLPSRVKYIALLQNPRTTPN